VTGGEVEDERCCHILRVLRVSNQVWPTAGVVAVSNVPEVVCARVRLYEKAEDSRLEVRATAESRETLPCPRPRPLHL
jgi:hypothetical protein